MAMMILTNCTGATRTDQDSKVKSLQCVGLCWQWEAENDVETRKITDEGAVDPNSPMVELRQEIEDGKPD